MISKKGMQTTQGSDLSFGQLLDEHLTRGTRANGSPAAKGVPWGNKDFANNVGSKSTEPAKGDRTVRNWRNSATLPSPADFHAILQILFGFSEEFAPWKAELTDRYHVARRKTLDELAPDKPSSASIPTKPPRCMGRDEDLKSVVGALKANSTSAAVLILGGPGMGKTTITREAANDPTVVAHFGHRRWFVELETAADAQTLETAIVKALGLDPATSKFGAALAVLAQAPGLLILDNLETPWDAARDYVEKLLAQLHDMPTVTILTSIRGNETPGGLRWTRQRTMHPLEWPHDRELFLDIAPAIKSDDPHLDPLLKELGGVPLVIELVAQQAAAHNALSAIFDEWRRVGSTLARRRGIEPSRLTALDISLELSFNSQRLGEAGRRLFSILGQLPAGIGAEDLKALLEDSAFEARHGLLACGLGFERNGRLDLLPPVRDHARRFRAPIDVDATLWRNHFLVMAREHGDRIGTPDSVVSIERLAKEFPNLEAAENAALLNKDLAGALTVLQGMSAVIQFTGLGSPTAIQQLTSACRAVGDELNEANCIRSLGDIAFGRSDHNAARKAYEQALSLFRKVGDIFGEANCIEGLGDIALERSDHNTARKAYEQTLLLYRQLGSILGEANCIQSLGQIALERSDHNAARKAYEQALPLFRQIGQILGEANCIRSLGDIAFERTDNDAARNAYEQALPLFQQVGQILGEANCIARLGDIARERSDHDAARKAYERALPLFRQVGQILGEANCVQSLGHVALMLFDHDAARKAYEQALPLYRQIGHILGEANCIQGLGDIARQRSDGDTARTKFLEALQLYERIHESYSAGEAHRRLASLTDGEERARHRAAARAAWMSIDRTDLLPLLD